MNFRGGNGPFYWVSRSNINANDHKLIFCSGRDIDQGGELHTNFKLSQTEGDWVILSNVLGNVVDSFKIVHRTQANHSVGRSTDGAADFKLFTSPTPNSQNTGAQNFYTPRPSFDIQAGFYPGAINVTITCQRRERSILMGFQIYLRDTTRLNQLLQLLYYRVLPNPLCHHMHRLRYSCLKLNTH